MAPGSKVGFCLYDLEPAAGVSQGAQNYALDRTDIFGAADNFCRQGSPGATTLNMGVSLGWRDVYNSGLCLQWVNVSDTTPGDYYLAAQADPERQHRREQREQPDQVTRPRWPSRATSEGHRPGRRARATRQTAIPLASDKFGTPGGPTYADHHAARSRLGVRQRQHGDLHAGHRARRARTRSSTRPRRAERLSATSRTATVTLNVGATQPRRDHLRRPGHPRSRARARSSRRPSRTRPAASPGAPTPARSRPRASSSPRRRVPGGGIADITATSTANPAVSATVDDRDHRAPVPKPAPLVGSTNIPPVAADGLPKGVVAASLPRHP